MIEPQQPVYVISKGRHDRCLTARCFKHDSVPFMLVVEPQEAEHYAAEFGEDCLRILPFSNLGQGSIPARNWVWEHAKESGASHHWIFDDNIRYLRRWEAGRRITCDARIALRVAEDFTNRYENIAITGFNYEMFGVWRAPVFLLNAHVYSSLLIRNDLPYRWRGRYNEDTDLCLQVLSGGYCTVQINQFLVSKVASMAMKGGNTDELYQGDGRLRMARALERLWPGVVRVDRRWGRPQHVVKTNWRAFNTPLIPKPDAPPPASYEMVLERVRPARKPPTGRLRRSDS